MEELVPLLNKLQDALVSAGVAAPGVLFDLPQIAVVGAQSVGKSSVLESLVGRQFLPSGTGIVTRRPLILQLRHARVKEEYGEFSHIPDKRFFNFTEMRKEIQRETERVGGKQKNVSPLPIFLRISSPHVIDLTLIDLPGITKVPVGDQPSDIELQVRRIVHQYISKPTAIILAVTAANTDIANSDSLKVAREVDPHGQRTVGVVTKIDTLEPGVDCVDLLCNRVIPLKHGYVGVVCRRPRQHSQRQEDGEDEETQQSSYRAAAQAEAQFFRSHAAYASIASQHGIPHLAKTLNKLLLSHVRQALPELRRKVAVLMQQTEAELANYGDPLVEAKANPGALLLHFFSKFARNFQDVIDGKLQAQQTSEQLMGGARINFIFHDWYSRALAEFDPLEGLSDQEIRTAIRNATGPKAALFVPEGAFEILVRKQIQQLETPSLQCVDQVYEELQKIVEKCELAEMSRFACLRERVMEVVRGVLRRCLAPTYQMIHNIIQIELAYINTNHPDFMNNRFTADARPPRSQQCTSCNTSNHMGAFNTNHMGASNSSSSTNSSICGNNNGNAIVRWNRRQRQQQQQHRPSSPVSPDIRGCIRNIWCQVGFFCIVIYTSIHLIVLYVRFRGLGVSTSQRRVVEQTVDKGDAFSLCIHLTYVHERSEGLLVVYACSSSNSSSTTTTSSRGSASTTTTTTSSGSAATSSSTINSSSTTNSTSTDNRDDGGAIHLPQVPSVIAPSEIPSEREQIETDLIKSLIWSYFQIVRKNVADAVPKSVMYFMVNTAKDVLQRELVSQLYREELFSELLKEGEDICERRARCKQLMRSLRGAADILAQIRDYGGNLEDCTADGNSILNR
ncbi:dynamin-1-like protein [Ochotona princeps]|uniref:dynamin-1-like protein n=1 Tax=Ochotona princeps TaxID=9978 RepID=UPI0027149AC7|nr:dynamin-1-like protein [Ochotona princeps]